MFTATETPHNASTVRSIVNGIDKDAVYALIDRVDDDPAKEMIHWQVTNSRQSGVRRRQYPRLNPIRYVLFLLRHWLSRNFFRVPKSLR